MRPQTYKIAALVAQTVKSSGTWEDLIAMARSANTNAIASVPGSPNFVSPGKSKPNPDAKFRGQKVDAFKPPKVELKEPETKLPGLPKAKIDDK